MKKKQSAFLILFFLVIFSCTNDNQLENLKINVQENFVELAQVKEIANGIYFETKTTASKGSTIKSPKRTIEAIHEVRNEKGKISFYVINYNEGGFILLSADNRTQPILAYSENGKFEPNEDSYPLGLKFWMKDTKKQITGIQNSNIEQSENVKQAWKLVQYIIANPNLSTFSKEPVEECYEYTETITVGPLLSTTWYQTGGFNDALPYFNCDGINIQPRAGCVPIAMAQVMKYHQYPTNYNWASMPSTYGTTTTANFIADIHVAINNAYSDNPKYKCETNGTVSTGVSDSCDIGNVLKTQFNYSYASKTSYNYITVKNNLDNNKPIILRGNDGGPVGHMWVCDGYKQTSYYLADCTGGTFYPLFNMNWGWENATYNGYFAYNNFNPGNFNFNTDKKMIYNITP